MPNQAPTELSENPAGEQQQRIDSENNDLAKLKHTLDRERAKTEEKEREAAQLRAQLQILQEQNPREVEAALAKAKEAEMAKQAQEVQFQSRLQEAEANFQRQLQAVTGELQTRTQQAELEALKVKAQADFLASDGLPTVSKIDGSTAFDSVWRAFQHRIKEDDQGKYVLDEKGKFPMINKETGKRVTLPEFYAELRNDPVHGASFKTRFGSGGGSRSTSDGRIDTASDLSALSTKELIKIGLKKS